MEELGSELYPKESRYQVESKYELKYLSNLLFFSKEFREKAHAPHGEYFLQLPQSIKDFELLHQTFSHLL